MMNVLRSYGRDREADTIYSRCRYGWTTRPFIDKRNKFSAEICFYPRISSRTKEILHFIENSKQKKNWVR